MTRVLTEMPAADVTKSDALIERISAGVKRTGRWITMGLTLRRKADGLEWKKLRTFEATDSAVPRVVRLYCHYVRRFLAEWPSELGVKPESCVFWTNAVPA